MQVSFRLVVFSSLEHFVATPHLFWIPQVSSYDDGGGRRRRKSEGTYCDDGGGHRRRRKPSQKLARWLRPLMLYNILLMSGVFRFPQGACDDGGAGDFVTVC